MKKRNKPSPMKIHDLVFVKFNARLKNKLAIQNRDPLVAYNQEHKITEWLVPNKRNDKPHEAIDEVLS